MTRGQADDTDLPCEARRLLITCLPEVCLTSSLSGMLIPLQSYHLNHLGPKTNRLFVKAVRLRQSLPCPREDRPRTASRPSFF